MRLVIKKILGVFIAIWVKLYSFSFSEIVHFRIDQLYTMWIRYEFAEIGDGAHIAKPLYLHGGKHIKIGSNFICSHRLRLDAFDVFLGDKFSPEIIIGNNVSIQKDCHIGAINKITIGNNVLLASKVYISDHSHGDINKEALKLSPALRPLFSKGEVVIEDNVWIGEGAVVLPNVRIGTNSIIGANAVVTKSVPCNVVVAGNPAQVIKTIT